MATIVYEQPVNELIRTALRLEHCFRQILHNLTEPSAWDSRFTLASIIETMNALDRPDLKTKLSQEFQRHRDNLKKHNESPNVDHEKLNQVLAELDQALLSIEQVPGKFAQELRDNKFIEHVRQHLQSGPGNYDTPAYHFWLAQSAEARITQLNQWHHTLDSIEKNIALLLRLTRQSAMANTRHAEAGFYQEAMDNDQSLGQCQLVRVEVDTVYRVYPEISAGKHRLSVRFLVPNLAEKPVQTTENIEFSLTSCCI